ncbi:MAG: hypothetical protein ABI051_02300 [Vicinamibacterales bacterium]
MTVATSKCLVPLLLVAVALVTGCDKMPTSPTTPDQTSTASVIPGHLEPRSSTVVYFDVGTSAAVRVNLAGVTINGQTESLDPVLTLRVGRPLEDGCTEVAEVNTPPRLTAQLPLFFSAGTYCVQISDPGTLAQAVDLVIRVVIAPPDNGNSAGTDTFSSNVAQGGTAARTVIATQPGDVRVTLASLGAPAGTIAALGLGLQGDEGSGCQLSKIVRTTAGGGPQLSASIDAGVYCVKLFEVASPQVLTSFTINIAHP